MHHGSRRFPVRPVTAGVSAESAGVCKAPSVICGLGFHGLDFKRCLAGLTSASSHTKTPKKCGVRGSLSRQPQPPGGTFSRGVEEFSWDKSTAPSHSWRKLLRMARTGHTKSRGWGVWGGRFPRGHRPGREWALRHSHLKLHKL